MPSRLGEISLASPVNVAGGELPILLTRPLDGLGETFLGLTQPASKLGCLLL